MDAGNVQSRPTPKQKYQQCPAANTSDPESSLTANDFKNTGNKLCSMCRYDEAITYYTKAISKNSEVPVHFSNRALCYLKLQQWQAAISDCRRAIELDPSLLKANFFLGQALAELGSFDEALKHLQRAHELAKERKMNFGDDIAYQIRLVKRRRWNRIEEKEVQLENEMQDYLVNLMKADRENRLQKMTEQINDIQSSSTWQQGQHSQSSALATTTNEPDQTSSSQAPQQSTSHLCADSVDEEARISMQKSDINSKCDNYIEKLENMFNNLRLQRKKREVPDYLCGKISFEVMKDPVITPSGITYDREDIEEHLRRVGHFDPITRQPLVARQLISNLAMKEVVDAYLDENEWAQYY